MADKSSSGDGSTSSSSSGGAFSSIESSLSSVESALRSTMDKFENMSVDRMQESVDETVDYYAQNYLVSITVAVAIGSFMGILASSLVMNIGTLYVKPWIRHWWIRQRRRRRDQGDSGTNEQVQVTTMESPGDIIVLKCGPNQPGSAVQQYKSCLENIQEELFRRDMNWDNVQRLTAHLVEDDRSSDIFRQTLSNFVPEYSPILISLLVVQRLEQSGALVEIEVLAG